jgi:sulfite reductase (NADPH) flavoprotein alpha-component
MPVVPRIPENAPFTAQQRAWLDGYLAGLLYDAAGTASSGSSAAPAAAAPRTPLLVAFGSQTGSAGSLAKSVAREADRRGFQSTVKELNQVSPADLASAGQCVIVTSTWGDGDPPDNAAGFWSALSAEGAPRLESLRYAVLGLGDRNYADFCGAAKKFDLRLEQLGAQRLLARAECDVDFQAGAKAWTESLWPVLTSATPAAATPVPAPETAPAPAPPPASDPAPAGYSRTRPFPARLKVNRRLNREGSDKDTRHLEIVLGGSGLSYEAGDALGVVPENDPHLVAALTARLGASGDEAIALPDGGSVPFREALRRQVVVTSLSDSLIREAASRSGNAELTALLQPERKAELEAWKYGRDLLDLLELCPGASFEPAELTGMLRRLQPRLYSISSSPKAHPGEVHLTVAVVRYGAHGRQRSGVCSGFLADRVSIQETPVPVFVQTSHGFRLPADGAVPIILIGPGTGIAPFRAFLEERRATGAKGSNWLFFGDQRRAVDFLYEEEVVPMHQDGFLTRLDLAFSRDQAEKIYVQNRMLEHAAELWRWLEAGAHVYVCGDAKRMAKDVDAALHRVIQTAGGRSVERAAEYVAAMKSAPAQSRIAPAPARGPQ